MNSTSNRELKPTGSDICNFDPLTMCVDPDSIGGKCPDIGICEGEKPVDAALDGRFNLDTKEETSACKSIGICAMDGVVFNEGNNG